MKRGYKFLILYLFTCAVMHGWITIEDKYRFIHSLVDFLEWNNNGVICPYYLFFSYPPSCWDKVAYVIALIVLMIVISPFWLYFLLEPAFKKY